MATKKKAGAKSDGKKKNTPVKKSGKDVQENKTEPLSNFQTPLAGRGAEIKAESVNKESTPDDHPGVKLIKATTIEGESLEIHKIKLRSDIFLTIVATESYEGDKVRNPFTKDLNWPVHEDLVAVLQKFAPHAACLLRYIEQKKIKGDIADFKHPIIDDITITQISLGNTQEGITITGKLKCPNKKVFPFNVPYQKFYDSGDEGYKFSTDLQILWDELLTELELYGTGKHGKPIQGELDFNNTEGNKTDPAEENYSNPSL